MTLYEVLSERHDVVEVFQEVKLDLRVHDSVHGDVQAAHGRYGARASAVTDVELDWMPQLRAVSVRQWQKRIKSRGSAVAMKKMKSNGQ